MVSKLALLQLWQSSSSSYLVRTTSPTWRNRTRVARILSCSRRWCVSRIQSDPWTSTRGSWEWGMGEPVKPAQVASPLKIPLSRIDIRHRNPARLLHVMWIYIFEGNIITQKNMSHPLFKEPYCQIMGVFMVLVFLLSRLLKRLDFPSMTFTLYFMGYEKAEDIPSDETERTQWMFMRKATIELTQWVVSQLVERPTTTHSYISVLVHARGFCWWHSRPFNQ